MTTSQLDSQLQTDLAEFENWMVGRRFSPHTVDSRIRAVGAFLREWGSWDATPTEVAVTLRRHQGWTARTYFLHMRSAFAWAVETGRVEIDPTARMKAPPAPRPQAMPYAPEVVRRAVETSSGRRRAYLLLAYLAGLRAHEIAKIRGENVTQTGIYVVGKGGRAELIPTHPRLWELAQEYPVQGYWFPSPTRTDLPVLPEAVSKSVRTHLRSLGVRSGSIHRVRASYGTDMLRSGTNVRVVQKLMRHSSLATTERYLAATEDEQRTGILSLTA